MPESAVGTGTRPTVGGASTVRSKSPTKIALDRLRADKIAMLCLLVVAVYVLIALVMTVLDWDWLGHLFGFDTNLAKAVGIDPEEQHIELTNTLGMPTVGISADHPFGLEPKLGRDLFARWLYGAQISVAVAFGSAIGSTIVGVTLGLAAGYLGGWVDRVISWLVDFFLALPFLLVAIAVTPVIDTYVQDQGSEVQGKARLYTLIGILVLLSWQGLARLIRGQVLSLREREFIQAAKAIGVPARHILFRELLPNLTGPIIISLSLALPAFVTLEAGLSYLGVGLVEPTASWGRTISDAQPHYLEYPAYFWQPLVAICVLSLSLNLLGDAVRDAFDPKTRR